ncbi:carboxylesterase 1D-like [Pecten maximus]|uniref:carboxylesterase 1D-like n=1 Tax=Pecten maximus TaxID=6579 RepID=UPI001458500A|nr:carboxylesterase 1D-like [Pecten maximus]
MRLQSILVWLLFAMIMHASCQTPQTVNTPSGPIKGVVVPTLGTDIVQFRNIPYAQPPIGNLRFEKPLPVEPWTETLDGTVFGPSCIQDTQMFEKLWEMADKHELSEDCLQLNVYVPRAVSTEAKKPVMFWIHGGAFTLGNSWGYDPSFFVMKDVIVVTINYRLGLFGFLSTEDTKLPSNFGIWDMIEALKWVNKNIASFGGDPESVTIFGESAGGFAVSYLAMIPSTAGLFKRIIPQSGSAVGFSGIDRNPARIAKATGKLVGCITDEDEDISNSILIDCLKTKTSDELLKTQNNPATFSLDAFTLLPEIWPVIDGELLKKLPLDSLSDPNSEESVYFRSFDMLAGTTSNEGNAIAFIVYDYQESMKFNITDGIPTSVLCDVVAPTLAKEMFNDDTIVSDLLCKEYTSDNLAQQARNLGMLYEDAWFVAPTVQLLDFHAKKKTSPNTYHYVFSKPTDMTFLLPEYPWMEGAVHGAELMYMFGPKFFNEMDESYSSEEGKAFTDILITYWTNFAKTGNPNGDGLVHWEAFTSNGRDYLELNDKPVPGQNLYERRVKFLLQDVPNKLNDRVKTEL